MIEKHVRENDTPYPILTDKGGQVAEEYGIGVRRTIVPALRCLLAPTPILVDRSGTVLYTNYTCGYIEEPDNREPLAVLDNLVEERLPTA
jgi:peroxiredoxin